MSTETAADVKRVLRAEGMSSSVMAGWEAFGVADAERDRNDPPDVRQLGTSATRSIPPEPREEWPLAELCNGVAGVQIHVYGDAPEGAYIHVAGTDRDAVEAAYQRAAAAVRDGLAAALMGASDG